MDEKERALRDAMDLFVAAGIPAVPLHGGAVLRVTGSHGFVEMWPETGKWRRSDVAERHMSFRHGVRALIAQIQAGEV